MSEKAQIEFGRTFGEAGHCAFPLFSWQATCFRFIAECRPNKPAGARTLVRFSVRVNETGRKNRKNLRCARFNPGGAKLATLRRHRLYIRV